MDEIEAHTKKMVKIPIDTAYQRTILLTACEYHK